MIAKVIVGGRSHVDYDGNVHHSCRHFATWGNVTMFLLFFGHPLSTVRGLARVIAKVIVEGFVDHGCCHFGAWGDVTVILLFFGPLLSTVRGVARVIAKVIVGGPLTLTMTALFTTAAAISSLRGTSPCSSSSSDTRCRP